MGHAHARLDSPRPGRATAAGARRRRRRRAAGLRLNSPPTAQELSETELAHARCPAAYRAGGMTAQVQAGWLKSFDDPRLPPLADEALLYNADLRIAESRVEIAAAALKAAGGAQWPGGELSPGGPAARRTGPRASPVS
jgi:outer membrane protein TolC